MRQPRRGARLWRRQSRSVGLWVCPLSPTLRVTAGFIVRGSRRTIGIMSLGRTWRACRARQIRLPARRLTICIGMARRRKRLSVGTVHGRRISHSTPDGVRGDKGLRLCGDGREDAVLVEAHAIRAAAVIGRLEAGAANLAGVSGGHGTFTSSTPCVAGSTCRQWRSSGEELAAGAPAPCSWAAGAGVLGMDRGVEDLATTPEGLAAGMAADVTDAGGPPCRDEALGAEGGRQRSSRSAWSGMRWSRGSEGR
jgi:hypothetical protein